VRERIHYASTFAVLATAALSFSLLQSLIVPAIPQLERSLHTSTTAATWLLTGYLLSAAICTPILGRIGDKIGKEKMIVIVLITLSVGTLISALASALPLMLLGRVIQGAGGAVFPLSFGIIRDEFPSERVAGAIGVLSAILGIGVGVGIVLAGPIIEHLSYHWLFWIPLVLTVGAATMTFLYVPESPVRAPGRINWLGAALMSGWLVTGLLAISYGPTWGWLSTSVLGLFAATVVLIACWISSERRSDSPLVDMKMMRIPAVWSTNLAALLFGFGMFAMFIIVPQFAQTPTSTGYGFGYSVTRSGLLIVPFAVAMLLIAPLTGRLTVAIGSKTLLILGSIFSAASYAFLAVAHGSPVDVYVASGLLGTGVAFGYASMSNLIVEAVPASQTGVATGMNTNIRTIGSALGSGVATSLVLSGTFVRGLPPVHGYVLAFAVCSGAMLVAGFAALLIPTREGPSVILSESHPGWTAEAEVIVGSIGYVAEEEG
jgi:EmrB/QacA subfamily drug resistance transporter